MPIAKSEMPAPPEMRRVLALLGGWLVLVGLPRAGACRGGGAAPTGPRTVDRKTKDLSRWLSASRGLAVVGRQTDGPQHGLSFN